MFDRKIDDLYKEHASVYKSIVEEAKETFVKHGKHLTIFHQILIDKVANSYIATLQADETTVAGDVKKIKTVAAELQKWLGMALVEERNAEAAVQARRAFYEKVVDVINDFVLDNELRKSIFKSLRTIVEE